MNSIRVLRYIADNYEQAQRLRISCGERIRAALQGRDWTERPDLDEEDKTETAQNGDHDASWVNEQLALIRSGEMPGPIPMLGRSYSRYFQEEEDSFKDMKMSLPEHPAWDWLQHVKGIGPTIACKLLSRLDVQKAQYDSSFWKYAGLATVPATVYRCSVCTQERAWPVGYKVTGTHKALNTERNCKGRLEVFGEGRAAQPRGEKGEKRSYDAYVKKTLYLLAVSFERNRQSPYGDFYRRQRAKCEEEHPRWAVGRQRYWAMRKTEKLFLSHLWYTWRTALGLPTPDPYAMAIMGHSKENWIDPWDMVEIKPQASKKRASRTS